MSDNEDTVRVVDADDVTVMIEDVLNQEDYYPDEITIEDRAIGGKGKTLVHGVAHARFSHPQESPFPHTHIEFSFEINAGTTKNDVILGELEVVIEGVQ